MPVTAVRSQRLSSLRWITAYSSVTSCAVAARSCHRQTWGLPAGGRRRTPGLRRDEVAALAHMSAVYYERLEQGRGPVPSATVLAGITDALRLTADERNHIYTLTGLAPPAASGGGGDIDPGLEYVLRAVDETTPASITDDLSNVVAQNWLNLELFGEFTGLPEHGSNLIWRWFTSAEWRHYLEPAGQHEGTGQFYVADLRAAIARRGHDSEAIALADDLRQVSPEFARIWDQHNVSALDDCRRRLRDGVDLGDEPPLQGYRDRVVLRAGHIMAMGICPVKPPHPPRLTLQTVCRKSCAWSWLKPFKVAASTRLQALATFARRVFPASVISGIRVRRSRGSLWRTTRPVRSSRSSWLISVVLSRALSTM